MNTNFIAILIAAIIPIIIGTLWYSPFLFQKTWMKESGITTEKMQNANKLVIYGLSFFFSFLLAFSLQMLVIHQWGIFSTLAGESGFTEGTGDAFNTFQSLMKTYGGKFRTFKHGAFHGVLSGVFIILPIIGIKTLFEQKSCKYAAINIGYWILTLAVMGGIICKWA